MRAKPTGKYRSKLEADVAKQIKDAGVTFKYEIEEWEYDLKVPRAFCRECDSTEVYTTRWYTPDFFLPNGVVIEAKGKLDRNVRKKMLAVKEAHPDKDLRFVFQRNNKIHKDSNTRYLDWAEQHGFPAVLLEIPDDWFTNTQEKDGENS